jgi:hypothetical protein
MEQKITGDNWHITYEKDFFYLKTDNKTQLIVSKNTFFKIIQEIRDKGIKDGLTVTRRDIYNK